MRICIRAYLSKTIVSGVLLTWAILASSLSAFSQDIPQSYFTLLIEQLKSSDKDTRARAEVSFINLGDRAEPAIPALIEAMNDPNPVIRSGVISVFGNMGPKASVALPRLIDALNDSNSGIRRSAAFAVGAVGSTTRDGTAGIIKALKDPERDVRVSALNGVTGRSYDVATLLPFIIDALRDPEPRIRGAAGMSLMAKETEASAALPALTDNLGDPDRTVRLSACVAIASVGKGSKGVLLDLISLLDDPDVDVRSTVASRLPYVGTERAMTAEALVKASRDPDVKVRRSVVFALQGLSAETKIIAPVLLQFSKDSDKETRHSAVSALGMISLADRTGDSPQIVGALIEALSHADVETRTIAAESLGKLGFPSKVAIPTLLTLVGEDQEYALRRTSARSLGRIAMALYDEKATEDIALLRSARDVLAASPEDGIRDDAKNIARAVIYLESLEGGPLLFVRNHLVLTSIFASYICLLLLWLGLFWFHPISLLHINEYLATYTDLKLPASFGAMTVPIRYLLLVGFFRYKPRVLDAWVKKNIGKARESFSRSRIVEERRIVVPLPALIDKTPYAALTSLDLQPIFSRNVICALLLGEGGIGKTSLACVLAKWAMAEHTEGRLCRNHLMVPILMEVGSGSLNSDLEVTVFDRIKTALRKDLDLEEHLPDGLLKSLLRRRRVLLIIDGLSEADEEVRVRILKEISELPINATIITSRTAERSDKLSITTIEPLRIQGNRISSFLEAYLSYRNKRPVFDDEEFFSACRDLSRLAGNGNITVMLARMYAELIIMRKEEMVSYNLPQNIPELMVAYLNYLNRGSGPNDPDDTTIRSVVQAIAWECLKESFRPKPAKVSDLSTVLGGKKQAQFLINYLERNLRLLETIGVESKRLRFTLDPLSEYFAALHLLAIHGKRSNSWRQFLSKASNQEGAPLSIKGFLLAIRDCVSALGAEFGVPQFVNDDLAALLAVTTNSSLQSEPIKESVTTSYMQDVCEAHPTGT